MMRNMKIGSHGVFSEYVSAPTTRGSSLSFGYPPMVTTGQIGVIRLFDRLVTAIYKGAQIMRVRSKNPFSWLRLAMRSASYLPRDRTPFLSPQAVIPLSGELRRAIDGDTLTGGFSFLFGESPHYY